MHSTLPPHDSGPLTDSELSAIADPTFGQFFLVSEEKLSLLIDAAGVLPTDRVIEIGAGVGTVARKIPACLSLTLMELDGRLIPRLQQAMPGAVIIQGDALAILPRLSFDVLLSNLPNAVTDSLLDILPELSFRTAVIATSSTSDLARLPKSLAWSEVTTITGDDFMPPQGSVSRVVRVVRKHRTES